MVLFIFQGHNLGLQQIKGYAAERRGEPRDERLCDEQDAESIYAVSTMMSGYAVNSYAVSVSAI